MNNDFKNTSRKPEKAKHKNGDSVKAKIKGTRRAASLREIVLSAPAQLIDKYIDGYDPLVLAKIFGDGEMMRMAKSFFENNLNVSQTAEALYMHRNTLTYRLNKIKKLTGLDIRNFNGAVSFQILAIAYGLKWRRNGEKQ